MGVVLTGVRGLLTHTLALCIYAATRKPQPLAPSQIHASRPAAGTRDAHACAELLRLCIGPLRQFDAQGLAIMVRTAAKLGNSLSTTEVGDWAEAAVARLPEFNPQDLANSIFAGG